MSTYICEKCGCIDNTGCGGNYWAVQQYKYNKGREKFFKDDFANTHLLCTECTPTKYIDGSKKREAGKWHNRFPKEHWSKYGTKERIIASCLRGTGNFINAVEYFKQLEGSGGNG